MIVYGFEFSVFELILFSFLLLFFIHQLYYYIRYLRAVLRHRKKIAKQKINFDERNLPVSIIICAKNELDNLRKFLPFVLTQDYPQYEVIVVNDGLGEATELLLSDLKKDHPHLRTTFVPDGTSNLSTKKLAITLGVKAAKYEWLLLTDADCMPEDKTWISRMARNFTQGTEFVLGYGAYFQEKGFLNRLISYDTLFNGLQYLGFALAGKPYMGVGRNMAYRKEMFFRQKGFAATLGLRSGDDDLLVNAAANAFNTRVEIATDSVTWSEPERRFKDWFFQKERHLSVASYYTPKSKFRLAIEPATRGLFYASLIFVFVFGNIITQAAALLLFLLRLTTQYIVINSSAKHFGQKYFVFTLPLFDIILPVFSLFIMTFGRMGAKAKNIKWR